MRKDDEYRIDNPLHPKWMRDERIPEIQKMMQEIAKKKQEWKEQQK